MSGDRVPENDFDAPYNTCADTQDFNNTADTSRETKQRYAYSGTGGDTYSDYTFTNQPKADFLGSGSYYVRHELSTISLDGLATDPSVDRTSGAGGGGAAASKKTASYYQLRNGRLGLVGTQVYDRELGPEVLESTSTYDPVFYDRLFTLTPGQTVEQTRQFSQTKANITEIKTITQKITFVGLVTKNLGGKSDYETCEFKVQNIAPASDLVTTKWYLVGKGILYGSETRGPDRKSRPVNTITLESASENSIAVFPKP